MIAYIVCTECSHTQYADNLRTNKWFTYQKCNSCGKIVCFRIVRHVEQPDGSVIEVSA